MLVPCWLLNFGEDPSWQQILIFIYSGDLHGKQNFTFALEGLRWGRAWEDLVKRKFIIKLPQIGN